MLEGASFSLVVRLLDLSAERSVAARSLLDRDLLEGVATRRLEEDLPLGVLLRLFRCGVGVGVPLRKSAIPAVCVVSSFSGMPIITCSNCRRRGVP